MIFGRLLGNQKYALMSVTCALDFWKLKFFLESSTSGVESFMESTIWICLQVLANLNFFKATNADDMFPTVILLPFPLSQSFSSSLNSQWYHISALTSKVCRSKHYLISSRFMYFFTVCVCVVWWQHLLLPVSGCPSVTTLTCWRVTSVWRCTMSADTRPSFSAATIASARRAWHTLRPKLTTTSSVLPAELTRV